MKKIYITCHVKNTPNFLSNSSNGIRTFKIINYDDIYAKQFVIHVSYNVRWLSELYNIICYILNFKNLWFFHNEIIFGLKIHFHLKKSILTQCDTIFEHFSFLWVRRYFVWSVSVCHSSVLAWTVGVADPALHNTKTKHDKS